MDIKSWQMLRLLDPELISKIKIACVFGSPGHEAIIVTKEDEVFSFGSNESGCLGLGEALASLSPRKIEALCNKGVKGFSFGSGPFVVAVTENGEVYSWGKNDVGQVGNNSSGDNVLTPNMVSGELLEKKVTEVACGGSHTLALTAEGQVYFWGMNYGQKISQGSVGQANTYSLGQGNTYSFGQANTYSFGPSPVNPVVQRVVAAPANSAQQSFSIPNQNTPKRLNFDSEMKVTAIACGNKTSMALLENGELYGWGYGDKGQLGLGDANDYYQPIPSWISSFKQIVITKVACGYAHTLAISDIGELFAWGDNTHGQLGTGNRFSASKPVHITSEIGRVVDIAAVHNFNLSAAMTENSEVYMWGYCRGQYITKPIKTYFTSLNDVFACCANVMPTPIRVDENAGKTVADSMRKAFNDPISSDLKIMVEEQPLYVHKAFLKIRCEHLRTTFHERWQENDKDVCEINNFPYGVYRPFLEYLYTDELKLPVKDALELLDLANSYCEERLKKKCVEIIKQGLTVENAAFIFGSIINYDIKKLEESCLKFSVNHMSAVIKTEAFNNLSLKTRMKFIEKAADFGAFKA